MGGDVAKRVRIPDGCDKRKNREGNPLAVPDIIIHKRGKDGPNVLVLEFKKTSNAEGWNCDRERIKAFREQLDYEFGALIECETRAFYEKKMAIAEFIPDE